MELIYESNFIECKPVSANSMYKNAKYGRKRKSEKYNFLEDICLLKIGKINLENNKCYRFEYEFFLERQDSDVDNYIKCFQDILQKKIRQSNKHFDDKLIYEIEAKKFFPVLKKAGKVVGKTGIKFKIFEIKIKKEIYGIELKVNKNLGEKSYEN